MQREPTPQEEWHEAINYIYSLTILELRLYLEELREIDPENRGELWERLVEAIKIRLCYRNKWRGKRV